MRLLLKCLAGVVICAGSGMFFLWLCSGEHFTPFMPMYGMMTFVFGGNFALMPMHNRVSWRYDSEIPYRIYEVLVVAAALAALTLFCYAGDYWTNYGWAGFISLNLLWRAVLSGLLCTPGVYIAVYLIQPSLLKRDAE